MIRPSTDTHFRPEHWDTYQLMQYEYAVNLCRSYRRAIDCGAHVGIQTHRMASKFARVEAFEPHWGEMLCQNMHSYSNWQHHPYALSNREGTAHLRVCEDNTGASALAEQGQDTTPVQTRTLDSFGWADVDLIKIDVEGHELELLQGAELTITQNLPTLLIEIEPKSTTRQQVETLLMSWNYTQRLRKNADTVWTTRG